MTAGKMKQVLPLRLPPLNTGAGRPLAVALGAFHVLAASQVLANPPALTERQTTLLSVNCIQCHALPGLGAPLIGDRAAWESVRHRGEDAVLRNVLHGIKGMPPLGYCSACTEEDFRALIRFVADIPPEPVGSGKHR